MIITENETAVPFDLKSHNGVITLRNPATGNHRTVRIVTQPKDANFAAGQRILQLMTGSDNESSYTGFAFVTIRDLEVRVHVWKSKRGEDGEKSSWQQIAAMIQFPDHYINLGVEYMFEGRCRVCNCKLTNPTSIAKGVGPVCAERAGSNL